MKFFSRPSNRTSPPSGASTFRSVKGTQDAIKHPILRRARRNVANSTWHQIFFDQDLGPSVGARRQRHLGRDRAGEMKPEEAAQAVQEAWDQRTEPT